MSALALRSGSAARWCALMAVWTVVGCGVGLVAAIAGSALLGDRPLTVMSGSMEPAIHTGDVEVTKPLAPLSVQVGDVVAFRDPSGRDRLISHRVREIHPRGSAVSFVTKGDANNTVEKWSVPAGGHLGLVVQRLPRLGYGLVWVATPWGRILLLVIPAVLLGIAEIVNIWRPTPKVLES